MLTAAVVAAAVKVVCDDDSDDADEYGKMFLLVPIKSERFALSLTSLSPTALSVASLTVVNVVNGPMVGLLYVRS